GDRWYGGGSYRDALAEYQLGLKAHPGDADLEAKLGAAALHVGDYATAVNAYIALGEGDRSRAGEAADGLERTARAALGANACSTAVPVFEGVIRRQREPAVADGAREGLGLCALVEGQRLVAAGKPAEAEDWFRRATAPGAPAEVVRGAFLGLGDVKLAQ